MVMSSISSVRLFLHTSKPCMMNIIQAMEIVPIEWLSKKILYVETNQGD